MLVERDSVTGKQIDECAEKVRTENSNSKLYTLAGEMSASVT